SAYSAATADGDLPDGRAISWAAASAAASAAVWARDLAWSALIRSTETSASTPTRKSTPAERTLTDPDSARRRRLDGGGRPSGPGTTLRWRRRLIVSPGASRPSPRGRPPKGATTARS